MAQHATLGGAHAVGGVQASEFSLGVHASGAVELQLHRNVGVEASLGLAALSKGDPPSQPNVAERQAGTALLAMLGGRVHLLGRTRPDGPWLAGRMGLAQTGSLSRLGFQGEVGWDFRTGSSRFVLGPFVGYTHILQPDDSFRPDDARLLAAGIHVAAGKADERIDRDNDRVFDDEDACPDVPGPRTDDPRTNGCPPDRDKDQILDIEDACPDVPGPRTDDPKTNGCPRDRDKDGIVDASDACPDVPGPRTDDPKTNGCPPDRDGDGIVDASDACPDVPGPKTDDPKTNGCPWRDEKIHVEGDHILLDDVILFDTNSPRVRLASWGIIKKMAQFIKKTPDILEVSVEGHADATGSEERNRVLSRERAESVIALLQRFGVEASRMKVQSFGRSRLKVNTQGAERANRRVEFFITRARVQGTPKGATP